MRDNRVKRRLVEGGVSLGTMMLEFRSPGIAAAAKTAGAEFAIFDMEHTGWSIETIRRLTASCPAELVPLVRVPATEYHFIARVLDVGALGIMMPMVRSEQQARLFVESAKYPPTGKRGAAFGLAHDAYDPGDILANMESANREGLLIAQIETRDGLENADAIAAVEGIDVLWVGQFDLTNSLGIPGKFDHPDFQQALDRVLDVCREHNKTAGYLGTTVDEAVTMLRRGFRMIGYGGDVWLYQQTLRDGLDAIRAKTS